MKRVLCLLAALCLLAVLGGCARQGGEEQAPVPTLAPAVVDYEAPDGDRIVGMSGDRTYYVPERGQPKLGVRSVHLEGTNLKDTVEALIRRVLSDVNGSGVFLNARDLELYREAPVEISRGICTVNLSSSALQLEHDEYYRLAVALSTTLCGLDEIRWVNVLIAGQSKALDYSGWLPIGSLSGHAEENLAVLWEQVEARRTPVRGDAGRTPVSAQASVYWPMAGGRGVDIESRRISADGQTPSQLASVLLNAMSEIVRANNKSAEEIPDLWEYMVHEPVANKMEEGGKLITVSFREDIGELTEAWGTDLTCLEAAVTLTLTTFVPETAAVSIRVGDKPVTEVNSGNFRIGTIIGGLMRRGMFAPFLTGSTSVYFEKDGRLVKVEQSVDRESADSPRAQLVALMRGPDSADLEKGYTSPLPEGLREDDLIGIAPEGDTMVVNLSGRFREAIEAFGPEKETLLCYALVNTLCENSGMKRVCFFFEGSQVEEIAGGIYWAGEFMFNPDM